MKSSFDDAINQMMQENVFDTLGSAAWTGIKGVGTAAKTAGQAAYGLSGAREAGQQLMGAASNLKQAAMGGNTASTKPEPPKTPTAAENPRPLKLIPNIDNKIRNVVNASGMTPSDRQVFQQQFSTLMKSMGPTVTDQQLAGLVAATLSQK